MYVLFFLEFLGLSFIITCILQSEKFIVVIAFITVCIIKFSFLFKTPIILLVFLVNTSHSSLVCCKLLFRLFCTFWCFLASSSTSSILEHLDLLLSFHCYSAIQNFYSRFHITSSFLSFLIAVAFFFILTLIPCALLTTCTVVSLSSLNIHVLVSLKSLRI